MLVQANRPREMSQHDPKSAAQLPLNAEHAVCVYVERCSHVVVRRIMSTRVGSIYTDGTQ